MPEPASEAQTPTLSTRFRPADHEGAVRTRWEETGAFHPDPDRVLSGERRPYCIFIPPPNVTARLHLGHALNNSLQDILARAHRMMGFEVLWMPGTDHAGIATQTVVEQRILKEEGKRRADFEREAFVARVQAWKDEYEQAITDQLKAIGCSCDWERQRFTMDEVCARAVREAFFRLFRDGLIYRGKRLVNWDPVTQTALSDDEVEMEEVDGHFYYLRYPLVRDGHTTQPVTWSELVRAGYPGAEQHTADSQAWVTVATTRPETYLGDTAVALNPGDLRAAALKGLCAQLPLVGRVIPIIEDAYVVMPDPEGDDPKAKYATGFLKVTPAHDPNDAEIGQRHGLKQINVMAPDASISDKHGWSDVGDAGLFLGLSREDARQKVVAEFKARGLLEAVKPYRHSVGHSYRSHAPIEPYLSDQWYCKVTDDRLRGWAQRALVQEQRTVESLGGTGLRPVSSAVARLNRIPPVSPAGFVPKDPYPPGEPSPLSLMKQIRNLPHLTVADATYFVTWRTTGSVLNDSERDEVVRSCLHWHNARVHLYALCVMPDHVHCIVRPLENHDLSGWVAGVKKHTALAINRSRNMTESLWQPERFDHIVRDARWFSEFVRYIVQNPVEAGLCRQAEEYRWTLVQDSLHAAIEKAVERHSSESCATKGDNALRFFPARYARTYESWHDNLRDWCISRQLWWGHRIPVWSAAGAAPVQAGPDIAIQSDGERSFVALRDTESNENLERQLEAAGYQRDPDVLDTWFSSALWPLSTLGWPEPPAHMRGLLEAFNPSSALCTAREIITLWVSRMVMFNRYFTSGNDDQPGQLPFNDVYIHPLIMDGHGQRMSKSLGNGVDPLDIVHSHGSDALRFVLAQTATATQDVRMPVDLICPHCEATFEPAWTMSPAGYKVAAPEQTCPACAKPCVTAFGVSSGSIKPTAAAPQARNSSGKFDLGRNFCTKLWNASRFTLMKLERAAESGEPVTIREMTTADRWILSRLAGTITKIEGALREYQFSVYAQAMYDLLWRDFCDWYLEAVKPTVADAPAQQAVLRSTLDAILRLLHPVCPFITEVIHRPLSAVKTRPVEGLSLTPHEQLCLSGWPRADASLHDAATEERFARVQSLVDAVREQRSLKQIKPQRRLTLHTDPQTASIAASAPGIVETLANLAEITQAEPPATSAAFLFEARTLALSGLADAVDAEAERAALRESASKLEKDIGVIEKRLANPGYTEKAPPHLVEETRRQLAQKQAELAAAHARLGELG